MAEVFVDGEKVEFRGESPGSLGDVLNLVQGVLSGEARVVVSIRVDGNEYRDDQAECSFDSADRIEIESLSEPEVLARLAGSSFQEIGAAAGEGRLLCSEVMQNPWGRIRDRCIAVAEQFGAAVQNVSAVVVHSGEGSPLRAVAARVSEALNEWIDAIGQGDASAVCLRMSEGVLPAMDALQNELSAIAEGKK